MKRYFYLFIIALIGFNSCEDDNVLLDPLTPVPAVSFDVAEDDIQVVNDETTYEIKLHSTSPASSDRTFTIAVNEDGTTATSDQYSFSPQVTIPAGELVGSTTLDFDFGVLEFGDLRTIQFDLMLGDSDIPNITRQSFDLQFVKQCTLNQVVLSITLDNWPDETSWGLYNLDVDPSTPFATGGPYNNPDDDFATVSSEFCLDSGNYGVLVSDGYGDGITNGGFTVTVNGNVVVSSPVTGNGSSATFTID